VPAVRNAEFPIDLNDTRFLCTALADAAGWHSMGTDASDSFAVDFGGVSAA
jgi:hypothetical protein